MRSTTATIASALLACASFASAQTYTDCNPLEKTCPSDPGLTSTTFYSDFTQGNHAQWSAVNESRIAYSSQGAAITVAQKYDAPVLSTDFYILFGYIEVKMRSAPGQGIISAIVLQSDTLDEVDWEWLGGNPSIAQMNFFGKGNTTTYDRVSSIPVNSATTVSHTYALNWTASSLTWLFDGAVVRTVNYGDAQAVYGKNYPQSPCRVKLGNWAGGASTSPGTVTWAGGATDFSKGPFTMYAEYVKIVNYNPASSYTYGDKSGSWQSITMAGGASSVVSAGLFSSNAANTTSSSNSSSSSSSSSSTRSGSSSSSTASSSSTSTRASSSSSSSSSSGSISSSVTSAAASASSSVRASTNGAPASVSVPAVRSTLAGGVAVAAVLGLFWI